MLNLPNTTPLYDIAVYYRPAVLQEYHLLLGYTHSKRSILVVDGLSGNKGLLIF